MHREIERGRVVIVAGFQGVDPVAKEVTTLGRGGSDATAVALAVRTESQVVAVLAEALPDGATLFVSNSMAVRDLDLAHVLEQRAHHLGVQPVARLGRHDPGVQVEVPVTEKWYLRPYANLGWGKEFGSDEFFEGSKKWSEDRRT